MLERITPPNHSLAGLQPVVSCGQLIPEDMCSVSSGMAVWRTAPATLRDVMLDREAVEGRLGDCPALERAWLLALPDRTPEALDEGARLLAESWDRFKPGSSGQGLAGGDAVCTGDPPRPLNRRGSSLGRCGL